MWPFELNLTHLGFKIKLIKLTIFGLICYQIETEQFDLINGKKAFLIWKAFLLYRNYL
jgi:hypothetical protein